MARVYINNMEIVLYDGLSLPANVSILLANKQSIVVQSWATMPLRGIYNKAKALQNNPIPTLPFKVITNKTFTGTCTIQEPNMESYIITATFN